MQTSGVTKSCLTRMASLVQESMIGLTVLSRSSNGSSQSLLNVCRVSACWLNIASSICAFTRQKHEMCHEKACFLQMGKIKAHISCIGSAVHDDNAPV